MTATSTSELLVEVRGGTLILTLNRPEARNAMTYALACAMAQAFDQLDADDSLRVAVLTGAGGHFCSGSVANTGQYRNVALNAFTRSCAR
jgi:enoyl-CoA hydratase